MEVMSASNFSVYLLSAKRLKNIMEINSGTEGLEFHLPSSEERPDNIEQPLLCVFVHQVRSDLCIPPPLFSLNLTIRYAIPLNQFHHFSICRTVTLHILCSFYAIEDSVGLIHATDTLKRSSSIYGLSLKPEEGVNFITHAFIDKDFSKRYFFVKPLSNEVAWPHA